MAAAVTATTLVVAGWMSGLRQIMHGALLSLAAAALLPFVLVAGGLLLILVVGFVLALAAAVTGADDLPADHGLQAAGEALLEGGGWLAPRYYRFLGRQRHPVFWGVPAGVVLGGLVLWVLLAALVIPGETRTVQQLTEAKAGLERAYAKSGGFRRPDDQGHLRIEATDASGSAVNGSPVVDGFGRPLVYAVSGKWKFASWTLTSLGFDGEPSADDLCVSGSTKLMAWAEEAEHVAQLVTSIRSGTASMDDRLAGIRALQCANR